MHLFHIGDGYLQILTEAGKVAMAKEHLYLYWMRSASQNVAGTGPAQSMG